MAELKDVVAYLLQHYPHKDELSNARVTKMVYLADWRHVLERGRQVSGVQWYFDNYGPFVWDIMDVAKANPDLFRVQSTWTQFGNNKNVLGLADKRYAPSSLSEDDKRTLDFVINATKDLSFDAFIKLVYSTYPIVKSDRYQTLDLPQLAEEYKETPVYQQVQPRYEH